MSRWEPNARGRLEQAAMQLYGERGFEQTTVAEIAERAGLTERTFFRYFADKREVLFSGAGEMREVLVAPVRSAPDTASAIEAVALGVEAVGAALGERRGRDFARSRQRIVSANAELRERELSKLASWASSLADALRERGVAQPEASLAGEVAIVVFRVAFERWVEDEEGRDLVALIRDSLGELRALSAKHQLPAAAVARS